MNIPVHVGGDEPPSDHALSRDAHPRNGVDTGTCARSRKDVCCVTKLAALRQTATRGRPFGDEAWTAQVASQLTLDSTLRPPPQPPP